MNIRALLTAALVNACENTGLKLDVSASLAEGGPILVTTTNPDGSVDKLHEAQTKRETVAFLEGFAEGWQRFSQQPDESDG